MRVLVTGANSLLGANVLLLLQKRGFAISAMVRSPKKLVVAPKNMTVFTGDITDAAAVERAVAGCDYVIHVAAYTGQKAEPYGHYYRPNVLGTDHVLEAARRQGVKRVVVVSSANAFAYGNLAQPGTEQRPICAPFDQAAYARSKTAAQQRALAFAAAGAPEVVIVNPTFMIGPYDSRPSSGTIVLRAYGKRYILVPPGGKNFVHVADVAEATCNALVQGRSGQCYLLAHENLSYRAFYQQMLAVTGQRSRILTLPRMLLLGLGGIGSVLAWLGLPTAMHLTNMRILCVHNYYDSTKAIRELALPQTPVRQAIGAAITWFRQRGLVKRLGHDS